MEGGKNLPRTYLAINEAIIAQSYKNGKADYIKMFRRFHVAGGWTAKKVIADGLKFDSQSEYARWQHLVALQESGKIKGLKLHGSEGTKFELVGKVRHGGKALRAITYTPDFIYVENGKTIAEDLKGRVTPEFKIKMRLFILKYGSRYTFKIVTARNTKRKGWVFKETV